MKSFELALAAILSTSSAKAQIQNFSQIVGLMELPSPPCLAALTSSLAAAEALCSLANIPSFSNLPNPPSLNFLNALSERAMDFSSAFCTYACGSALNAYIVAVNSGCRSEKIHFRNAPAVYPADIGHLLKQQDVFQDIFSVTSYCGNVQIGLLYDMVQNNSFTNNTLGKMFCNPCGAGDAGAYRIDDRQY
ncbi:hypothetical protein BDK51DRAFT_50390 [Blyttiomyces helicus]|uniref:Uncharacterized protein n=1 Tax=Blyttiomyces helicus TaxID=388810 RepID=A0A4V1IRL1_9FUNG|nr:hypothetical protein BDK51DRAFT_50390 [Blyttiomyces helicus]|eukprot:RKO90437.1 hypothetical protein BDK51DRAFT_50390 [Blyttiomyces helicus]